MWDWLLRKKSKDSFSVFVENQKKQCRKVKCASGFSKKMREKYGANTERVLRATSIFLSEILDGRRAETLSLVFDPSGPPAWLNKSDPSKTILNFVFDPTSPETQAEIKKVVAGIPKVGPETIPHLPHQQYFKKAIALAKEGKLDEAIEMGEKAFQLNGGSKRYRYQLALLHHRRYDIKNKNGFLDLDDLIKAIDLKSGDLDKKWLDEVAKTRKSRRNVLDFDSLREEEDKLKLEEQKKAR